MNTYSTNPFDPFNSPSKDYYAQRKFTDQTRNNTKSQVEALDRVTSYRTNVAAAKNVYDLRQKEIEEQRRAAESQQRRSELWSIPGMVLSVAGLFSDLNIKKDITLAADAWGDVKGWELVNYLYKDQPDEASPNLGVIAQQVAEVTPDVVVVCQEAKPASEGKPAQAELLGINERKMVWMAIKALQEAQERIEQLEYGALELRAQIVALEARRTPVITSS